MLNSNSLLFRQLLVLTLLTYLGVIVSGCFRRMAALDSRANHPKGAVGTTHHSVAKHPQKAKYASLSKEDREIAERLDRLKEDRQKG